MAWHVTVPIESYDTARDQFEWNLPDDYNLAYGLKSRGVKRGRLRRRLR